jgi:hypothetical protein
MRNVLVHQYMQIQHNVVWDTATQAAPALEGQLRAILAPAPTQPDPAQQQIGPGADKERGLRPGAVPDSRA